MSRAVVVVLNWNGARDTVACVQSLLGLSCPEIDVVVCDNDSAPADVQWLAAGLGDLALANQVAFMEVEPGAVGARRRPREGATIALVHTGSNLGFAGGVNIGLRYALAQGEMDYAWVLNNDTVVDPGALTAMLRRMEQDSSIGICGSSLIYFDVRNQVQAHGGAAYQPWRGRSMALGAFTSVRDIPRDPRAVEARLDYVVGASMLVSRRFLDTVGLMDDRYFLYSEEHDWAHRGRRFGFKLAWAPDSIVFHKHGATIGTSAQGGSALSLFYLFRSKALFAARHTPLKLPVVLMSLAVDAIKFAAKGHPEKTWAALRGLMAFPRLGRF
jgi:GT2 family glycosyltransferase